MSPNSRNIYVIKVQDRKSGERLDFEITARSVHEAEAKAFDAGWLVIDPSVPASEPTEAERATKAQEVAVKRGVLKALDIALLVVVGLIVIGNIIVFLVGEATRVR